MAWANRDSAEAAPEWHDPAAATISGRPAGAKATASAAHTITVSATGDIMMSNAPSRMPPNDGARFFDSVAADLKSDLVMGNLEQPLTDDTGGFAPYAGVNNLNDLDHSRRMIQRAKSQADLVVVQVHMGAEGAAMQHVKPGAELFYGENRGDPITFSHAVIDAGADLVIGHSPHVLRAMEVYRGKLIAYSLGNFAGGGRTLSGQGALKYGGILRVTLAADGTYVRGEFRSTYLNSVGLPTRDRAAERGRALVAELTAEDFGHTGATIAADGSIAPSA